MKHCLLLPILFLVCLFCGAGEIVDHGVASPVSNPCGVVTTANAKGENLVLSYLADATGCPAILVVNAARGTWRSVMVPDPVKSADARPMASLLSRRNRYYSAFGGRFYEFDPETEAFTFHCRTSGKLGMGMTEDDRGVIWTASWPDGQLCSFDPAARKFTDHGRLIQKNWNIYPRSLAADDRGRIYAGIGNVAPSIYVFDPRTGETQEIPADRDLKKKIAAKCEVRRDRNGKVYGWVRVSRPPVFYELYDGKCTRLTERPAVRPPEKMPLTGPQTLFDPDFPDGSKLVNFDPQERCLVVAGPDGKRREIAFDYPSAGTHLSAVAALPDGTIRGAAMLPMRMFTFDTRSGKFTARGKAGFQWNAVFADGEHLWIGGYGGGGLLDWDTRKPFEAVKKRVSLSGNPRTVGVAGTELHRPSAVTKMPDGRTFVMAGTPGYGRTGGGLAVFDDAVNRFEVIPHEKIFGDFSASALVPLSSTTLLIGGTAAAGTGGIRAKGDAPMMIYDLARREAVWRGTPISGAQGYLALMRMPSGLILGVADREKLFVFDAEQRRIMRMIDTAGFGPVAWHQGPRVLLNDGKRIFVLFAASIAELLPEGTLRKIADVPSGITAGGAIWNGRIYFCSHSHLMSCAYPQER